MTEKDFTQSSGREIRALCRTGEFDRPTAGVALGYAQANLVVLGPDDDVSPAREPSWLLPANGALIDALREVTGQPRLDAALLVVDYRGHVVLTYPPAENGPGVLKDLKRLLRASPRA